MVSGGRVPDLLFCWRSVDHYTHSLSGPLSSPRASTVAVGLLLLQVIGISVSKGREMATSGLRQCQVRSVFPLRPLSLSSLAMFPANPSVEIWTGDTSGSQRSRHWTGITVSSGGLSRLSCKFRANWPANWVLGTELTQLIV